MKELGHCVFYWMQGIPASMSLVMEFPLVDITASQYGVGSMGGPLVNILLIVGAYYMVRKYEKKSNRIVKFKLDIDKNSKKKFIFIKPEFYKCKVLDDYIVFTVPISGYKKLFWSCPVIFLFLHHIIVLG